MDWPVPLYSADKASTLVGCVALTGSAAALRGGLTRLPTTNSKLARAPNGSKPRADARAKEVERPDDSGEEGRKDGFPVTAPVTAMGFSGDLRGPNCFPN